MYTVPDLGTERAVENCSDDGKVFEGQELTESLAF